MKGMYDGAASVKSHPSRSLLRASSPAAARTPSGSPSRSPSSVRCSVHSFRSAKAFWLNRSFNSLSSSSLRLYCSRASPSSATPCRTNPLSVFSSRVSCSVERPASAEFSILNFRFSIFLYSRRSVITRMPNRVISGSSCITVACSSSLVQHSLRFVMMAAMRLSRRSALSRASTVFSNVGSPGSLAMASTAASASAMAWRMAGL